MTQEVGEQSVINVIYHLFDFVTASADRAHVREPPTNESAGAFVASTGVWLTPAGRGSQVRKNNQHLFILFRLFSWRKCAVRSQHSSSLLFFV